MAGRHRKPSRDPAPLLAAAIVAVALTGTWTVTRPLADSQRIAPAPPVSLEVALPPAWPEKPPPDRVPVPTQEPAPAPEPDPEQSSEPEPGPEPAPAEDAPSEEVTVPAAAPLAGSGCSDSGFGGVAPHVAEAGHHLQAQFGVDAVIGVASRSSASDHPRGYALDFMVDRATGDDLATYAIAHAAELGVKYVIWEQRYNPGDGWSLMEDRGGITANHFDHVHISFTDEPGSGLPC